MGTANGVLAAIGRGNWISGFPLGPSGHFARELDKPPALILDDHAAIMHSIDLVASRQSSEPIEIGEYCLVGTEVVVLGGSRLPHHPVLAAKSLLNKQWEEPFHLYGGVPAKSLKKLPEEMEYFRRQEGFVW